jgi:Holliday junction resolvasome RuvABC ATP-dependent DNA helicase subunit
MRLIPSCVSPAGTITVETPDETPKIYFKDGEPTVLTEYEGQGAVTSYLQAVIDGMSDDAVVPVEHQLFLGPPGIGKSLLAKTFANTLLERNGRLGLPPVFFQEDFPADMPDMKSLDARVRRWVTRPTIAFIDEIHDLKSEGHFLKLYLLLEEGRYKFEGEFTPTPVSNVVLFGATTDYGAMHPAFKRRFNRHELAPLAKTQLFSIVKGRTFPIEDAAAAALVERTHFSGAPWEALQLYRQAIQFAKARKATSITLPDVQRVFETQQIDYMGLRGMDRRVISVLLTQPKHRSIRGGGREFVCFAASEKDVVAMAQVDHGEYRESVKPRLMARGLLQVRATYGQALTPLAVTLYQGKQL